MEEHYGTVYQAFGFNIISEIALPELPVIQTDKEAAQISIYQADLASLWTEMAEPNQNFVIHDQFILFRSPGTAIYLIRNGMEIFVSPLEGSQEDRIRLYLLGTCMGALLLQRRVLPLHGSAIHIDGAVYAIVGDSGAGKSTLASAFLNRGYQLMSDDVIPVTLSDGNIPFVIPAYPQQKLWEESLTHLGMESKNLRPIIDRETKYAVPVASQFVSKSMPLTGVIELMKTNDSMIEINPIQNLERLQMLFQHTYRNFLVARLGLMDWHFKTTTSIVSKADCFRLVRPTFGFTVDTLVDTILTTVSKGEKIV